MYSFTSTIVGLGAGPTLVALITQYHFRNAADVGKAITVGILPAVCTAIALYYLAARAASKTPLF
jgi:hypothetical protein